MTHYEKLATVIFRILGVLLLVIGIFIGVIALLAIAVSRSLEPLVFVIFYTVPMLILGVLFFATSRKLAKRVCFDFDKFNE